MALAPRRLSASRIGQEVVGAIVFREQGPPALIEGKYLVERRVHRGFEGRGPESTART